MRSPVTVEGWRKRGSRGKEASEMFFRDSVTKYNGGRQTKRGNQEKTFKHLKYAKLFMFELQMQTGSSVLSRFLKHHLGDQRVHPDKKRSIEMLATAEDNIFVLFDWFIFCWLRGPA